jgi:Protein of unknown function (DUF3710)
VFRRRRREDADESGRVSGTEQDQDLGEPDELADDELGYDELDDELAGPDDDELDDDELDDDETGEEPEKPRRAAPAARADDLGDPATWTKLRDSAEAGADVGAHLDGPWDSASGYPEADRMDFGSLLVPVREGFDIQVNLDEEAGVWVAVVAGDSGLQLQAFAAPKTSGLWEEVRQELVETVAGAGGRAASSDGPFGPEVLALLSEPGEDGTPQPPQPMRFIGADGPRWFLRGLITGPAARDPELARPLEEIFGDVVVVRGEHPEPPRKALDIQLPEEARQAIEEQFADQGMPNPFERGPEITEIR